MMRRRPKVAHLTTVHGPDDPRILWKECVTLARQGYDVTLVVPHNRDEVVGGVSIKGVPQPENRAGRMTRTVWHVLRAAAQQGASVYHFHDPELMPVGLWLRARGAKVIYDVHEDLPAQILTKYWIPGWLRRVAAAGAEVAEKIAARLISAVVVATPSIARRFPASKTVLIQNYPRLEVVAGNPAERGYWARRRQPYRFRPNWVVYIGSLTSMRGCVEMVKAIELVPEALKPRLVLAGNFSPPSLKRELERLEGWARVEYLGWRRPDGVACLLDEARVGLAVLHPTPRYVAAAMPTKLFEYMAAGIPIVASDFLQGAIAAGGDCGLVVDPLDPAAIAAAIEYLLTHPEVAEEMGRRGEQAVRERYNWEIESEKLISLYHRLTGGVGAKP